MFDFIVKGGPVMIPIIFGSIVALAIVIERLINLRENKIIPQDFFTRVKGLLLEGHINEVLSICSKSNKPIAKVIEAGIMKYYFGRDEIKEAIEDAGRHEIAAVEKYLNVLSTIAAVEPLLGLLGTVTGMIRTFNVITTEGMGQADKLAGGIGEALITTAAGLAIAIPTLVLYNLFMDKADRLILKMEKSSMELTEILSQGQREEWKV
jgi:biopolymer transport protein ExbB